MLPLKYVSLECQAVSKCNKNYTLSFCATSFILSTNDTLLGMRLCKVSLFVMKLRSVFLLFQNCNDLAFHGYSQAGKEMKISRNDCDFQSAASFSVTTVFSSIKVNLMQIGHVRFHPSCRKEWSSEAKEEVGCFLIIGNRT